MEKPPRERESNDESTYEWDESWFLEIYRDGRNSLVGQTRSESAERLFFVGIPKLGQPS